MNLIKPELFGTAQVQTSRQKRGWRYDLRPYHNYENNRYYRIKKGNYMDFLYKFQIPESVQEGKDRIRAELLSIVDRYDELINPIEESIRGGKAKIQAALINTDWTDQKRHAEADRLRKEIFEGAAIRMGAARAEIMSKLDALDNTEAAKLKINTNTQAYVMAAANAYKTIEMLGENLLPDQLTGLCQTFIDAGDTQTLSIIKGMCTKCCPKLLEFFADQGNPFDFGQNTPGILHVIRSVKNYMLVAFRSPAGERDASCALAGEFARQEIEYLTK